MKSSLALLILLLLLSAQLTRAEPKSYYLGYNGKETLMLDPTRISDAQYPVRGAGSLTATPARKTYKEAWVMFIDSDGKIAKQVLWVFDCTGRAAELAASFSLQTPKHRST
jgi:hypothetical protein